MGWPVTSFLQTFAEPVPQPLGYHIVVRPRPPKEAKGSILLSVKSKQAELMSRTIGQVVAKGELAWKAKMSGSGLDFQSDPVMQGIAVGDWVIYRQHAGQRLRFTDEDPDGDEVVPFLLIMNDTDVLAKITEEQSNQFYDWLV